MPANEEDALLGPKLSCKRQGNFPPVSDVDLPRDDIVIREGGA